MNDLRSVLRAPVVTEKATIQRDKGTYTFRVDRRANKIQIRHAVESIFDVQVAFENESCSLMVLDPAT